MKKSIFYLMIFCTFLALNLKNSNALAQGYKNNSQSDSYEEEEYYNDDDYNFDEEESEEGGANY